MENSKGTIGVVKETDGFLFAAVSALPDVTADDPELRLKKSSEVSSLKSFLSCGKETPLSFTRAAERRAGVSSSRAAHPTDVHAHNNNNNNKSERSHRHTAPVVSDETVRLY